MDAAPEKQTKKIRRVGDGTPGPGRPKGVGNKNTTLLKDAILLAAQKAGGGNPDGLVNYLEKQATENPTSFMSLLGKILPMQVANADGGAFVVQVMKFADDSSAG